MKSSPDHVRHVLLSAELFAKIGERLDILAATAQQTIARVTPQSLPDATGHYPVEIACISRDVTGQSTKTHVQAPLQRYYDILRNAPQLRWVHAHSAGADRPIYPELMAQGVMVTTSSGANADAVAHTALGGIIALGRQFSALFAAQAVKQWQPLLNHPHVHSFKGQKVMIIGLGPIGQELAQCLQAMGMQVVGVTRDPAKYQHLSALRTIIPLQDFIKHIADVDYLVLACPLTERTRGLINRRVFQEMQSASYVINVARGEVVVQQDLIAALQAQTIRGAFLDVFEVEPLDQDSALWNLPNVIISPHTAGHFSGHNTAVEELFLHNFAQYLQGLKMLNKV